MWNLLDIDELNALDAKLDRACRTWDAIYHYSPLDNTNEHTRISQAMAYEMIDARTYLWTDAM